MSTPAPPAWSPLLPLDALPAGESRLLKLYGKQIALFHLEDGALYAIDNRCPHEGYPLAQGVVKGCLLTCAWHNFKFDLRDGACVMGDEAVRTFPLRVHEGQIEADLTDPDPALAIPGLLKSLREGLFKWSMGRVARDTARLLEAGHPPEQLAAEAAAYDGRHAEYGSTHALPVAADVLRYLPRYPGLKATLPLIQALDLAGRGSVRMPPRPLPAPQDPGGDPVAAAGRIRDAVEDERGDEAQALLLGGLARGYGRAELQPLFFRLCADHFLDIGHPLIYTTKVFDLLDAIGWDHADAVLTGFLHGIVCGTREDTLPKWAGWQARREALRPRLPALFAKADARSLGDAERDALLEVILEGKDAEATGALIQALEGGAMLLDVAQTLVLGASHRLLRFDEAIDADPTVQNDWLDITHTLTFAAGLTEAVARWEDPGVIELLLQGARFVNLSKALDRPEAARFTWTPEAVEEADAPQHLMDAIAHGDTRAALGVAQRVSDTGWDLAPLRVALEDRALRDPAVRPIFVAHHIKLTLAALDQYEALPRAVRALPLLALVRFLAAPAVERSLVRTVHEAVAFVAEGVTPRVLT